MKIVISGIICALLLSIGIASGNETSDCKNAFCYKMKNRGPVCKTAESKRIITCDFGSGPEWSQVGDLEYEAVLSKKGRYSRFFIADANCYLTHFYCDPDDDGKTHYSEDYTSTTAYPSDRGAGNCSNL